MEPFVCRPKCPSRRLEDIEEDGPASCLTVACAPPETPTESMEFLARSWSLSSLELCKALTNTSLHSNVLESASFYSPGLDMESSSFSVDNIAIESQSVPTVEQLRAPQPLDGSPPASPRGSEDKKEMLLLHQALNPEFLTNQQLLKNGFYKSALRGKTMGRRLKELKEKKRQEIRAHKAQIYAATSVAGVAAAIAAIAAATATSASQHEESSKISSAVASAAALVASHCVEVAEDMGADRNQILTAVDSAVNVRTTGDILTLTAGAATALRGAATLNVRLQKGYRTAALSPTTEEQVEGKDLEMSSALNFISNGGELLKRTRKGALHWKQVSFYINSNWQVVAKIKSKHMVGAFTKKKKCVVSEVYCDIPSWPGRESDEGIEERAYFGIKTADRLIEFECRSICDKQMWTDGIRQMLHRHAMT